MHIANPDQYTDWHPTWPEIQKKKKTNKHKPMQHTSNVWVNRARLIESSMQSDESLQFELQGVLPDQKKPMESQHN